MPKTQPTLYDSLRIITPYLKPSAVPPRQLSAIKNLARKLPAIHCAGFECRLGVKKTEQVDFQQRILARNHEPHQLQDYISYAGLTVRSDWKRISQFCDELTNPASQIHRRISEFWLEFDLKRIPQEVPTPSVFFSLNPPPSTKKVHDSLLTVIKYILKLLLGMTLSPRLESNLLSCRKACQNGERISDIGTMLSRRPDIIRINIGGISPDRFVPFLNDIGWRHRTIADIEMYFQCLFQLVDRVSVCLDVGDRIYPQIGLEGFLDQQPDKEHRWFELFDMLVAKKLCTSTMRDALLFWPGYVDPVQSRLPWPNDLMIKSFLNKPDKFIVIGRRLSHVKLVFPPAGSMEAKGYFGFGPLWLEPAQLQLMELKHVPDRSIPNQHRGLHVDRIDINSITEAIEKGTSFLLKAQNPGGSWKDFESLEKGSDEWVTAYTGAALATISFRPAQKAARQAWAFIAGCRGSTAGWGYNGEQPVDMDSTAWGLRLAYKAGQMNSIQARAAESLIRRHIQPNGRLSCYTADAFPQKRFYLNPSVKGWCSIHTCVTAAAAVQAFGEQPRNYLRFSQKKDGSWKGYWWEDDEYPTSLAVSALAGSGMNKDRQRLKRAAGWALRRFSRSGAVFSKTHGTDSAFATACALQILLSADFRPLADDFILHSVAWLLSHQRTDGSWPPSAWMRIPPANIVKPRKNTKRIFAVLDQNRIFTTTTVLGALEESRHHLKP